MAWHFLLLSPFSSFPYKKIMRYLLQLVLLLLILSSCLNASKGVRTKVVLGSGAEIDATATSLSGTPVPTVNPGNYNYFQNGSMIVPGALILDYTFNDSFYLRGNEIHKFLSEDGNRVARCMVVTFSTIKKTLILALDPKYFYSFPNQSKEYYYNVNTTDQNINSSACQKAELLAALASSTSSSSSNSASSLNVSSSTSFVYDVKQVCPNGPSDCAGRVYSTPVKIFAVDGKKDDFISVGHLSIVVKTDNSSNVREGVFCEKSSECITYGFQCCLGGQCVNDGLVRPGIDTTSAAYLQAKKDIDSNPSKIKDYFELFYVCSKDTSATPSADRYTPTASHEEVDLLKELYDCTVAERDETSVCTVTVKHASTPHPGPFYTNADDRT
ncbi:MAG: hypothetical protein HQK51_18290, partial [Oligoflexia bacterium]|nr:hypothetical protein [Oligoflexia bacterium]